MNSNLATLTSTPNPLPVYKHRGQCVRSGLTTLTSTPNPQPVDNHCDQQQQPMTAVATISQPQPRPQAQQHQQYQEQQPHGNIKKTSNMRQPKFRQHEATKVPRTARQNLVQSSLLPFHWLPVGHDSREDCTKSCRNRGGHVNYFLSGKIWSDPLCCCFPSVTSRKPNMRQPPQNLVPFLSVVISYRKLPEIKEMTAERIGPDFAGIAAGMSITSCPAKFGPILAVVVSHR